MKIDYSVDTSKPLERSNGPRVYGSV